MIKRLSEGDLANQFEGKLAFITGAGSGIGAATARLLARRGATLALADIDENAAHVVAEEIVASGGDAKSYLVDVADARSVELTLRNVALEHGGLDLAVNAAGIVGSLRPCADYDIEEWQRVIGVNLTGLFFSMHFEVPQMLKRGAGAIVNLSSIRGRNAGPGTIAYAASKHGVEGATKAAALDYATQGIRVNAVAPGYVDTPLIRGRPVSAPQGMAAAQPLGRIAQPEEIAELIAFLLSPQAAFITGSIHPIDGGFSAR